LRYALEEVRRLLNWIVLDVRVACAELERFEESDFSAKSDKSEKPGLIPTHGGYRTLKRFQVAEIVYDGTVIFCH
jgi:hypothetical protein